MIFSISMTLKHLFLYIQGGESCNLILLTRLLILHIYFIFQQSFWTYLNYILFPLFKNISTFLCRHFFVKSLILKFWGCFNSRIIKVFRFYIILHDNTVDTDRILVCMPSITYNYSYSVRLTQANVSPQVFKFQSQATSGSSFVYRKGSKHISTTDFSDSLIKIRLHFYSIFVSLFV